MKIMIRLSVVVFGVLSVPCAAQRSDSLRDRAVDAILLKDRTRLLGTVIDEQRDESVTLMMRGRWLNAEFPDFRTQWQLTLEGPDADTQGEVILRLEEKIAELESRPDTVLEHVGLLEEKIATLQREESRPVDVLIVTIPTRHVRRQFSQSAVRRKLAGIGIINDVDDVERMSARDLELSLKQHAGQLMLRLPDDQQSVSSAERILLDADYAFGRTLRLIGYDGQYFDAADRQAMTKIVPHMLQSGLQNQLQNLLSEVNGAAPRPAANPTNAAPTRLPPSAAAMAQEHDADVVELTTMAVDPGRGNAEVFLDLYRADGDHDWKLTLRATGRASSADVGNAQVDRILQDPRVQQIQSIAESFNVKNNFQTAVSIGAVVEIAQDRAKADLQRILNGGNAEQLVVRRYVIPGDRELPVEKAAGDQPIAAE